VAARVLLATFGGEGAPERRGTVEEDRPLSDLLVEQIEVSNAVLLNKADLCSGAELERAEDLVTALQPAAETVRTEFSAVDPDWLFGLESFEETAVEDLPGWKRALDQAAAANDDGHGHDDGDDHDHGDDHDDGDDHGENGHHSHRHPDEVYGVSSFTFRRRRPFHPERFADVLRDLPEGVVRSKGTTWVAGSELRQTVAQAGPSVRVAARGPWIASLPEVQRDLYRSNRPNLEWDDEHGDRRTEYVVIGTDFDEDALRQRLADALVTDEEWERRDELDTGEFPTENGEETVVCEPTPTSN
jgi:G3E family GTPase